MSEFGINTRVFWGDYGKIFYDFLKEQEFITYIVIVDKNVAKLERVQEILNKYKDAKYLLKAIYPLNAEKEPTYDMLDNFTKLLSCKNPDFIVAIGGGSTIDLAKGVGVLLKNSGSGIDYRGMHKVKNPGVPVIAYPTTAGTGTEVTWTAVFIDDKENKKLGINGRYVAPLCGILDSKLVAKCPKNVAISAGLDAMVHAIEAFSAKTATDISKLFGSKAFSLIYQYLPVCLTNSDDLQAWEKIQLAAYLAGIALMNVGGGPASAISYPLGVYHKVPHGIAGGIFLSGVFKFNVDKGYLGYSLVYDNLYDSNHSLDEKAKAEDFVHKFNQFYERIAGPRNLKKWGCKGAKAINNLVNLTMRQRLQNLELNPVPFKRSDVKKLLEMVCV